MINGYYPTMGWSIWHVNVWMQTHTHTHIYIYIYIIFVKHVDKFAVWIHMAISSSFCHGEITQGSRSSTFQTTTLEMKAGCFAQPHLEAAAVDLKFVHQSAYAESHRCWVLEGWPQEQPHFETWPSWIESADVGYGCQHLPSGNEA